MYFEIESQVFPLNITEEISYFDPFHVTGQRFSDVFMRGGGGYRKRPVALNGSMSWVVVRNAGFFLLRGIGGSPPTSSKFAYSPTTWKNITE